jgi:DNA-binding response OmpR family regulator
LPHAGLAPFVAGAPVQEAVAQRCFHVLVVDDHADTLALAARALEGDHHRVYRATNGPDALRMIAERIPDLVVLDYKMEGMDGMAVTKALRANAATRRLPVLMLTAMTDEASTREGFEVGATDYVTKPFSIPQLTSRVRACLARAQPVDTIEVGLQLSQ